MEHAELTLQRADLSEPVRDWLIGQLHLVTDNFHIRNYEYSVPMQLTLYSSDGGGHWLAKDLGDLAAGERRWLTLTPLTAPLFGKGYPADESVLVITPKKERDGKTDLVFIDNTHSLPLTYAGFAEADLFSRLTGGKLMYMNTVAPKTPYALTFSAWFSGGPEYGRWELWFQEPVLKPPLP